MSPSRTRQKHPVPVSKQELRSAREVSRTLGRILDDVQAGKAEKVVVLRHGQPAGVIVSFDRYGDLLADNGHKGTG